MWFEIARYSHKKDSTRMYIDPSVIDISSSYAVSFQVFLKERKLSLHTILFLIGFPRIFVPSFFFSFLEERETRSSVLDPPSPFSRPPSMSRRACDLAITWLDHESWNTFTWRLVGPGRLSFFLLCLLFLLLLLLRSLFSSLSLSSSPV